MTSHLSRSLSILVLLMLGSGCKSAYYGTWEKLGWEKRDILSDRVEDARDSQNAAKEQFKTTLERFQEVTKFQGGDLEAQYKKLSKAYESATSRADDVREHIDSVETVAQDMFTVLHANRDKDWVKRIEEKITIRAVPMLNPDGAELFVRRSLQGIDINRDAIDLKTPEAQLLKRLRDEWRPPRQHLE